MKIASIDIDTIMSGSPNGYKPFSKKNLSLPIIFFSIPKTGISVYRLPTMDSIYTIQCEMVGFKNKEKSYRLKIRSDQIRIIKRDTIEKTYTFQLIKDSAKIDCYIEGQYKPIIYWRNDMPGNKFQKIKSELKIGQTTLVIKK